MKGVNLLEASELKAGEAFRMVGWESDLLVLWFNAMLSPCFNEPRVIARDKNKAFYELNSNTRVELISRRD